MDQQFGLHQTKPCRSATEINFLMNLWKTVQGVSNLNIDCNWCGQRSNTSSTSQAEQTAENGSQMHGLNKSDVIPLRSAKNSPLCKKKTVNNDDGSTSPPHGGKKRRENDRGSGGSNHCCIRMATAPWIVRNYAPGMVGLHEEIEDFYNYMRPTEEEHCMREHVIQSVKDVVVQLWPTAKLDVFGSFRTNLYLSSSDIDIVLFGNWTHLPLWTLRNELISKGIADESTVKVLDRAAVPIIKFQHLETHVKVDISFNMNSGVKSVQLIKEFINKYPVLPKLVFVLKQFLLMRELNEVWTGGVSSYSLLLLCVSFLQLHPRYDARQPNVNLGVLLIEFFELYGRYFNYQAICIRVRDGGRYICKHQFRQLMDNGAAPSLLSIEDPLTTGNDLGRGSYGMLHVKQAFDFAYHILTAAMIQHDYNADYQHVSHLSLIVKLSESVVEYRRLACERWRVYLSAPSVTLDTDDLPHPPRCSTASSACSSVSSSDASNSCPAYTSSEGYNSSSSTESDLEDQEVFPGRRRPTNNHRSLLHRAKSMDCIPQPKEFLKKPTTAFHQYPERTRSADSKKSNSGKRNFVALRNVARTAAIPSAGKNVQSSKQPQEAAERLASDVQAQKQKSALSKNAKSPLAEQNKLKSQQDIPANKKIPDEIICAAKQNNTKNQSKRSTTSRRGSVTVSRTHNNPCNRKFAHPRLASPDGRPSTAR